MQIITIKSGGYEAKINASRGANCISLTYPEKGVSVLREPDYSAPLDNPYLYGMPVLFPQNRISGGKFEFEGRVYDFGINEPNTGCFIHGTLHEKPFEVVESGDDYALFRYDCNGDYLGYKENFSLILDYKIGKDGLTLVTTVENRSDNNMPIFLGFHTTFNLPFVRSGSADKVKILVSIKDEIERDMSVYLPTGKILPFDEVSSALNSGQFYSVKPISRHYKVGEDNKIELYDELARLTLVYENDEAYPFRLVYNGQADGYICIEPQTSSADAPSCVLGRDYCGFSFVKPRSKASYCSKIYLK